MSGQTLKEGQHKGQENLESGNSEGARKLSHGPEWPFMGYAKPYFNPIAVPVSGMRPER